MNKRVFKKVVAVLGYVCLVVFVTFLVVEYVGQCTEVEGMSMYPTLDDKEYLILDKLTYRFREPERYDIVVFPPKYKENTYYIKRIIGLPGEEVLIADGQVYINGEPLPENYGYEKIEEPGLGAVPFRLGEDEYFVLGDNRNDSLDSRDAEVGNIKREDIIGRAFLCIWPLSRLGFLKRK